MAQLLQLFQLCKMQHNYIKKIKFLLPSGLEHFIERISVKFKVMDRAYIIRKQFPLSLSYGITIHKSHSIFSCDQV